MEDGRQAVLATAPPSRHNPIPGQIQQTPRHSLRVCQVGEISALRARSIARGPCSDRARPGPRRCDVRSASWLSASEKSPCSALLALASSSVRTQTRVQSRTAAHLPSQFSLQQRASANHSMHAEQRPSTMPSSYLRAAHAHHHANPLSACTAGAAGPKRVLPKLAEGLKVARESFGESAKAAGEAASKDATSAAKKVGIGSICSSHPAGPRFLYMFDTASPDTPPATDTRPASWHCSRRHPRRPRRSRPVHTDRAQGHARDTPRATEDRPIYQ